MFRSWLPTYTGISRSCSYGCVVLAKSIMVIAKSKLPDETSSADELLAWNLKKYRIAAGLSQQQLGEKANVDRTYVGRLERVVENPSIAILDKLAAALSVHVSALLQIPDLGEDAPSPMKAGRKVGYRSQKPSQ